MDEVGQQALADEIVDRQVSDLRQLVTLLTSSEPGKALDLLRAALARVAA